MPALPFSFCDTLSEDWCLVLCPESAHKNTQHIELQTYLKGYSSQPHNFEARDPSLTILRCQNFVVCGEEHIIFVLLGYHRTYRDKGGAINWRIAHNSQIFVERNKSFQFL